MDISDLIALFVVLIERDGGALEITEEEVADALFDGRSIAVKVVEKEEGRVLVLTLEREEDIDGEVESQEDK
jgi:hypothetical protein